MVPQVMDELLIQAAPADAAGALARHSLGRQQRLAAVVLALLGMGAAWWGGQSLFLGQLAQGSILLLAGGLHFALLAMRIHYRQSRLLLQWAAGCIIALYFYLLTSWSGVLWGLALAPAVLLLLGPRLGMVVFGLMFAATWWIFEQDMPRLQTVAAAMGDTSVFEHRSLYVLALLGGYGFLLEYDRHRVIRELLAAQSVLRELATVDELTGIANRRAMQQTLLRAERRNLQQGAGFGLVLGDIDLFKQINDNYGHECGDMVIAEVARALSGALRDGDAVARWGGEEFLILLPDTDVTGALAVAEKLRVAVSTLQLRYGSAQLAPTISFGIAATQSDEPVAQLIRRADRALYRAKHSGRNCIVEG